MNIRVECYLVVLKRYKEMYPEAHFEVITQTAKSCLSPSKELLNYAKEDKITFHEYKVRFLKEIRESPIAIKRLKLLKQIAKDRMIFLVCFEKDASKCHRSIVRDILINPKLYGFDLS